MNLLGYSAADLDSAGGGWTAREIAHQPVIWPAIVDLLTREGDALRAFLDPLLRRRDLRIVLTGAGTSAFVGECLAPALKLRTRARVEAVPTTDLVGSPDSWLEPAAPTLLVSFARSGNSPESAAALSLVEQGVPDCHHLIVTCNAEGDLYRQGQALRNAHVVLLPEATNDRGFAMTSSFTGMMLAAALAFDLLPQDRPAALTEWAAQVLGTRVSLLTQLATSDFERVVYLGGGAFKGLAREAALKLLELSDGKVVALAETPLGFRHGPKTIVNDRTLVVMFLSNDAYSRRYEMDVLRELRSDDVAGRVVALQAGGDAQSDGAVLSDGARPGDAVASGGQVDDVILPGALSASDLALCFPYAVFAQIFAFLQSMTLGVRPDTPNASGVVSRVVQGVSIYPWNPAR
jgi:tagatose-6-phosphate ketose/aldose isomerase